MKDKTLKELFEDWGIKQAPVAEFLRISVSAVSRKLSGRCAALGGRRWTLPEAIRLRIFLNMNGIKIDQMTVYRLCGLLDERGKELDVPSMF